MHTPATTADTLSADTGAAGPRALAAHLDHPKFISGTARGWWTVHRVAWPVLDITVRGDHSAVSLRFDLTGYPAIAPTAQPWDLEGDQPLPPRHWPQGPRAAPVFNPQWSQAVGGALYLPFDRRAQAGHECWDTQFPEHIWHPNRSVRDYLLEVRAVLQYDERTPR